MKKTNIENIDKEIQETNASWQKPDFSSPLQFVYFVAWGGDLDGSFQFTRYFVIEVQKFDSNVEDEFRARVTIKKRFGYNSADNFQDFYETFFPNREISMNDVLSILGL